MACFPPPLTVGIIYAVHFFRFAALQATRSTIIYPHQQPTKKLRRRDPLNTQPSACQALRPLIPTSIPSFLVVGMKPTIARSDDDVLSKKKKKVGTRSAWRLRSDDEDVCGLKRLTRPSSRPFTGPCGYKSRASESSHTL